MENYPHPNLISIASGSFKFDQGVKLIYSESILKPSIDIFSEKLNEINISINDSVTPAIFVKIQPLEHGNSETYRIGVKENNISLVASEANGIFYGLMTLWQGMKFSNTQSLPCGCIEDSPRYAYRGGMLDESRHFFGKEKVKQIIELMSNFKLNNFHWHLTDDPGWRLEIKSFPKLAQIGGLGNHTNANALANYYTQEEIKEIVAYATDRFVTIIPEIDIPGHAKAANNAYPEYSGGGSEKHQ